MYILPAQSLALWIEEDPSHKFRIKQSDFKYRILFIIVIYQYSRDMLSKCHVFTIYHHVQDLLSCPAPWFIRAQSFNKQRDLAISENKSGERSLKASSKTLICWSIDRRNKWYLLDEVFDQTIPWSDDPESQLLRFNQKRIRSTVACGRSYKLPKSKCSSRRRFGWWQRPLVHPNWVTDHY